MTCEMLDSTCQSTIFVVRARLQGDSTCHIFYVVWWNISLWYMASRIYSIFQALNFFAANISLQIKEFTTPHMRAIQGENFLR